jgi:hypothetical protein
MCTDENFLFGGILHKGNSFTLSEPVSRMGVVRNGSRKPFKKDDKRAPSRSNINIDISYVIQPKSILSEPFC